MNISISELLSGAFESNLIRHTILFDITERKNPISAIQKTDRISVLNKHCHLELIHSRNKTKRKQRPTAKDTAEKRKQCVHTHIVSICLHGEPERSITNCELFKNQVKNPILYL